MGLLKADQLRSANGLGNTDLFKQWAAKAWINFNGTVSVAVRDSRNASSVTDHGTGDYSVNFATAFANANYSFGGGCDAVWAQNNVTAPSASQFRLYCADFAGTSIDRTFIALQTIGDLA